MGEVQMSRRAQRWTVAAIVAVGALTAGVGSAAAVPVSTGHSGWFWASPQPQGNTLSGLDFAGNRGYAAGEFGTLLRTDDAGATWTGINTGLTDPLVRVRVLNPQTVVVGGLCALRRSNDGGASFSRLPWTASDENCPSEIASFHFPSPSVGYLMTKDGSIFRTTDGGETFSRQTSVPGSGSAGGSREPADIFFTSDTTGIAITRGGSEGKVFRTTDSGNSWTDVATAGPGNPYAEGQPGTGLNGLTFVNNNNGFIVGAAKRMLATTDGGQTWDPKPLAGAPVQDLRQIDCADSTTCLITEGNGHVLRTTDGGDTGADITPSTGSVNAVAFASATRVVGVGDRGTTVVSDDGGLNYSPVGGSLSVADLRLLRATSAQIANVGGANGTLVRTTNGGESWSTVGVPTTATVLDASFPNITAGYAIDALGGAFKTINGGASWQILNTGTTQAPSAVLATGPNDVLLAGPVGIRRSTDGGSSFAAVGDKDLKKKRLNHLDAAGTGAVVAWGREDVLVSADGGATWKRIKLPKKTKIVDASFVGTSVGYILTSEQLLRTKNGGRTWKDRSALGTSGGYGISFGSADEGFVTVRFGALGASAIVLHTNDGGASFQPQLINAEGLSDLVDVGPTAFAISQASSFFTTDTGGEAGIPSELTLTQVGRSNAKRAAKQGKVKLTGTLRPAEGGEQIGVMYRDNGRWRMRVETAATNGEFTSAFKVKRETVAVAQWLGDDTRAGDGSKAVRVRPAK
jgi:photosystem II stability/assembly factor-like uncharacterized protein